MRTILAALALTLFLSLPATAQTLALGNAQYKLGSTLEEAIKTGKMWDHSFDIIYNNDEAVAYTVLQGKNRLGALFFRGGRLMAIEKNWISGSRSFGDAYAEFLNTIEDSKARGLKSNTLTYTGFVADPGDDASAVMFRAEGKNVSVEFRVWVFEWGSTFNVEQTISKW